MVNAFFAPLTFGFGSLGLTVEDFAAPGKVVQLGVPPVRVDIVTSITGCPRRKPPQAAHRGPTVTFPYILGREEFLRNKRALGRKKDTDVEAIGEE